MRKRSYRTCLLTFLKREMVMTISFLLAVISMFFVKPSPAYLSYIDFRTLSLLLCLMLVMAGLRNLGVFRKTGGLLLRKTANTRQMTFVLVFLCFVSSMLITNDVALITFVPFALELLALSKEHKLAVPIIVLQTLGANLGSMLTPLGNPQNLYLYSLSRMPVVTFVHVMLPYTLLSMGLLVVACLCMKRRPIRVEGNLTEETHNKPLIVMYLLLFLLCLCCVLRILPYLILLAVVLVVLLIFDRKDILRADYGLLLTFTFLFIFIGNLSHMDSVSRFLADFINGREMLSGVLFSQAISNVPAAILLSGFTDNYRELLIGVNLGGLGTLIASMASLISFKFFSGVYAKEKGRYLAHFTLLNLLFLVILYGMAMWTFLF